MKTLEHNVTVFDRIMSQGKSSNMLETVKNNPHRKYLYVVPLLSEIERVQSALPYFVTPTNRNRDGRKHSHLLEILSRGENVVTTHSLFRMLHIEDLSILKDYVLILDEVVNVIEPLQVSEDDSKLLFNTDYPILSRNDDNTLNVIKDDYRGKHIAEIEVIKAGRITYQSDTSFIWMYDPDIFRAFDKIIVLTFRFQNSILDYYFRINNFNDVEITYSDREDFLVRKTGNLINLFEPKNKDSNKGNYNWIGSGLSFNWYKNADKKDIAKISNKVRSYFRRCKAPSNKTLYTTFSDYENDVKPKGFSEFLSHNAKAMNQHGDKTTLAYTVNRFLNPYLVRFIQNKGIEVNQDDWALSELIQWIYRGSIRRGKPMNLLIMSERMRNLYKAWIDASQLKNVDNIITFGSGKK